MDANMGKNVRIEVPEAVQKEAIKAAKRLIKAAEGWHDGIKRTAHSDPMLCPTGYVTVGWGRVLIDPATGKQLKGKAGLARAKELWPEGFSREACEAMLDEDVGRFCLGVIDLLTKPVTIAQLAAMISLSYNIGLGRKGFAGSSVLRLHNAGDVVGAARAFSLWVKGTVDGKRQDLPGLVIRRAREASIYLHGADGTAGTADASAAAHAEVKPLASSRTIGGSATVIAATATSVVIEAQGSIQPVHDGLAALGIDSSILKYVLAGLVIAGAALAIYARVRDRMEGRS